MCSVPTFSASSASLLLREIISRCSSRIGGKRSSQRNVSVFNLISECVMVVCSARNSSLGEMEEVRVEAEGGEGRRGREKGEEKGERRRARDREREGEERKGGGGKGGRKGRDEEERSKKRRCVPSVLID